MQSYGLGGAEMQMTVRVPDEYGEGLNRLSKRLGIKKSDLLRMALRQFLENTQERPEEAPSRRVSHLLGIAESGVKDLGQRHREHLIRMIRESG
jgi:Arc/MetJ-type ribon-helix-helix transcriptional regulator